MWIMVSGPYRSGSKNPEVWRKNLDLMNQAALKVFQKGHTPIIGVNLALPIIELAGESEYESLMMPISLSAAKRCDAVLRIGGESRGADQEVELFRSSGRPVYKSIDEVPCA